MVKQQVRNVIHSIFIYRLVSFTLSEGVVVNLVTPESQMLPLKIKEKDPCPWKGCSIQSKMTSWSCYTSGGIKKDPQRPKKQNHTGSIWSQQQAAAEPTATRKMWHGPWRITSSRKKKKKEERTPHHSKQTFPSKIKPTNWIIYFKKWRRLLMNGRVKSRICVRSLSIQAFFFFFPSDISRMWHEHERFIYPAASKSNWNYVFANINVPAIHWTYT